MNTKTSRVDSLARAVGQSIGSCARCGAVTPAADYLGRIDAIRKAKTPMAITSESLSAFAENEADFRDTV